MSAPTAPTTPRRAALVFIFVTVLLDILAMGSGCLATLLLFFAIGLAERTTRPSRAREAATPTPPAG